jgi:hypothetical protein
MGNLSNSSGAFEVFSGYDDGSLVAYSGSGDVLAGWPRRATNYISTPPALADVDGDGLDEIFIDEEDFRLHAYRADGSLLPGWPIHEWDGLQERVTPAIADLDSDGDLEIVTASGFHLFAYHHDGTRVNGFPVFVSLGGYVDKRSPVIGDVDGDGAPEIIVGLRMVGYPYECALFILSGTGEIKRSIKFPADFISTPVLADLDGDSIPEIIVQEESKLNVWRGDGSVFPGWPVVFQGNSYWLGWSSPVVGDVDGDGLPDIVVTNQIAGSSEWGDVRVYNRNGALHPHFPKTLPIGSGGVPAIADIDLDGRNEIIITGAFWNGYPGYYDKVWVFDLGDPPHGAIHWGQFMGGPKHQGYYVPPQSTSGIFIVSPNGGEAWTAGSTQTICWNYVGNPGSFVKIELLKGGVTKITISSSASIGSGGTGSYIWFIPSTQTSGSDYQIRITSTSNSSYSDISDNDFTIVGPPPPPASVSASDGTYRDKVEVTWASSFGATSYAVYRTTLGTTSETTFDDTTATTGRTYYYWVKASNTYGTSGYSAYDKGYRSDGRPPAPSNVQASDGTYTDRVRITWIASTWADSYRIYRATSTSRRATKVAIGTTTEPTYDDTTASAGRTYYYWVKASNSYGESGFSAYDSGYR